ncbi:hypothetical protein D3C76_926100 [compost metagenome]
MGAIVVQRQRASDAGAGEQQPLLGFQVRDFFDQPQRQRMAPGVTGQGVEQ